MNGDPMWWSEARKPGVHEQRQRAAREARRLAKERGKNGRQPSPVAIEGRTIARSFWGKAWCENLESCRDYEYRLPRGRSYLRNGAVLDLDVTPGQITAVVSGSTLYEVRIAIQPIEAADWGRIKGECAGEVGSLIELLEGRLSERVMRIIAHREQGLFPRPAQITMSCSCPDRARMCKHVAAVMYGVGARLDAQPQLLFTLRQVDHGELIAAATELEVKPRRSGRKTLASEDLGEMFGIELTEAPRAPSARSKEPLTRRQPATRNERPSAPTTTPARAGRRARSRRK